MYFRDTVSWTKTAFLSRKLRRSGSSTGSKGVEWPFYWQLHSFLGTLPVNDSDLMQESVEMPEDPAQTGQEIDFEYEENLIPVPATIPCTLEEGNDSTAGSEPAGREQGTSGERCGKSNLRRKRPSSSLLRELMAMHQQAEERAAKAAKESSELRKQLIELQKESNEVQKGMIQVMKDYLQSKENKE
ncbi:uncharacterized protein LOC144130260 isoform X1 [Amblyomma americanum]